MMARPWRRLLLCIVVSGTLVACGDDDQKNNNQGDATVQLDGTVDGDGQATDADVLPDSGPATGCTGAEVTEPQLMGACCNDNPDCIDRTCLGGFCTMSQCLGDEDCYPTVPGPFPGGTPMSCNDNQFGFISFCAPGSLQPCGATGDAACPEGEACVLGWNPDAPGMTGNAMRGLCMTKVHGEAVGASGAQCDPNAVPYPYQCEAPSFILGNCIGRRCVEACDPDNATNTCPASMECIGPLAFATNGGLLSGGGLCGGSLCGAIRATGDPELDYAIPGVDGDCPTGQLCTPMFVTGVDGDTYEFRCIPPASGLGGTGEACEHADKFGQFCNHDGLCLQQSASWVITGAPCDDDDDCGATEVCVDRSNHPSRCAPKPDPGFCSKGCRTDADCTGFGEPAYCLELGTRLPNGHSSFITACYPASELFETAPTACTVESDCDLDVGEGCLMVSRRSDLRVCGVVVSQDATGTDCSTNGVADCEGNDVCIEDPGAGSFLCTGISEKGDTCEPNQNKCRSGWCLDSELMVGDQGDPTNTLCSGFCRDTSDCGQRQVCDNVLFAQNDPDTSADDVVSGMCRSTVVRTGTGCGSVNDCGTNESCDTATGRCYNQGVAWGSPCAADSDCDQNGMCDTTVPNGLCYLPGCNPANGNADCGGGASACSAQSVVGVCLASCTTSANCREADGFTCVDGACVAP